MKALLNIIALLACPLIHFGQTAFTAPTGAIYISGYVCENDPGKERIEGACVWVQGTKTGCMTDKNGEFKLDITSLADTASGFTVLATFIAHKAKEVVFKDKVRVSLTVNFALTSSPVCEMPDLGAPAKGKPARRKEK